MATIAEIASKTGRNPAQIDRRSLQEIAAPWNYQARGASARVKLRVFRPIPLLI
ncbi:hypothetical protein QRQ56_22730 [Bradyrhizobium sp. U531]|uniref:hypothetical protein n=1 Tax=Bradyrhizobium sp. U531 TaxID=3053458 RepID=UPI003F4221A1